MIDNHPQETPEQDIAQARERLEVFIQERARIHDGGGIIGATNGQELLLSDLQLLMGELRRLDQAREMTLSRSDVDAWQLPDSASGKRARLVIKPG